MISAGVGFGGLAVARGLARADAVVMLGDGRISCGWPAWWRWGAMQSDFQFSMRNRVIAMAQWLWSWLEFERGARLITGIRPGS